MGLSEFTRLQLSIYDRFMDLEREKEEKDKLMRAEQRADTYLDMAIENHYRQIQKDEEERTNRRLTLERLAEDSRNARNNEMVKFFWTAMTDPNVTDEERANFQGLAKEFASTLTPQQQAMLSGVFTRSLFSPTDLKVRHFEREFGKRPEAAPFEPGFGSVETYAEQKFAQADYDYKKKAFLAGGYDKLPEDAKPGLLHLGTVPGTEGSETQAATPDIHMFAYKNPATGQVGIFNTGTDVDGEQFLAAKKNGFGPARMQKWDLIPFKESKGKMMKIGNMQYEVWTGTKISTGENTVEFIPIGEVPSREKQLPQPPQAARDIVAWHDSIQSGVDKEKAGKYHGWMKKLQALESINIPKEKYNKEWPSIDTDWGKYLVSLQRDFTNTFPGWTITPNIVRNKEAAGFYPFESWADSYQTEDMAFTLFPSDGILSLLVDGEERYYHYKQQLPNLGQHVWFDYFGNRIKRLQGVPPGASITLGGNE